MKNTKLISFRKEKNLSKAGIAEKIGVSKSYYEKIEYGDRTPSYNFLAKFKEAFPEITIDAIFLPQNHTKCEGKAIFSADLCAGNRNCGERQSS